MTQVRKLCFVTGARAEYGLLQPLMRHVQRDRAFDLQIIATGMHLSPEFGLTYKAVEADGFGIDEKVEMLLSSDTAVGLSKSLGLGLIGIADALERLKPDMLVLLGDRFETLAAAQAALFARLPLVHIAGGDTTEGAFDESIRHAITKMAHIHFVTNELSKQRVIQMGESPERVFVVGSPGIDQIHSLELLSKAELERELAYSFLETTLLLTFHPTTLEDDSEQQLHTVLDAIEALGADVGVIITGSNADTGGRSLMTLLEDFAKRHAERVKLTTSLGQRKYLSVMKCADVVVGNSSSGLYEAPSFGVPAVNIGERQKGRLRASSVIDVAAEKAAILAGLKRALSEDFSRTVNPYGDGNAASAMMSILRKFDDPKALIKKRFHTLNGDVS